MPEIPPWVNGKHIDEVAFCKELLTQHPMKCVRGCLYDIYGMVPEFKIRKEIFDLISPHITSDVAVKVTKLLNTLMLSCAAPDFETREDRIAFHNGTWYVNGCFTEHLEISPYRLPISYHPEAPEPTQWLNFLDQLLYPEDIITLQEFMGYLLLPTTRGQKMLILIGRGGEGKSRIGRVLRAILGDYMNTTSIQKLATDRFCRADQIGKLLMLDDDLNMTALPDTNILKSIITIEDKMDLETKGKQSFQGELYVRLMGFGNGSLSALYDRSDGFYRRQITIQVKEKDPDRVDDPHLGDCLVAEAEGILLWMMEGLKLLIADNFHFTISDRTRQNMDSIRRADNNIMDFYDSTGYIRFEPGTHATTRQLYGAYLKWCQDNLEKPLSHRTFSMQLYRDVSRLNLRYVKNIPIDGGKYARGYYDVFVQVNTDGVLPPT